MVTETQRKRQELSDRIQVLAKRYAETPQQQIGMDFVAEVMDEWIVYRNQLAMLYGNKTSIQIKKLRAFLSQVKTDFTRGMDDLIEEYDARQTREPAYIQHTLESATSYLGLYIQAGLHRVGEDKKHVEYGRFIARLKRDVGVPTPNQTVSGITDEKRGGLTQKGNHAMQVVYGHRIAISDGTVECNYELVLGVNNDGKAYWAAPPSNLQPEDTFFPTNKKIIDLEKTDIARILAAATKKATKSTGTPITLGQDDLAIYFSQRSTHLIETIYRGLREKVTR